jgi:Tol biopolymer transport system component
VIYVMGLDQETGQVTTPARELPLDGFSGEAIHAEWLPGNRLAVLGQVKDGLDALLVVPAAGGAIRTVHTWKTEHKFAGLGASPDGRYLAFIGPGADGHFQLFRIPAAGGTPEQLTWDPTNKTQPSYSPDGKRIALTVFEYSVQFWIADPGT